MESRLTGGRHRMTIREQTQEIQARTLSKYASLSQNSLGRERPVEDLSLIHI